MTTSTAIRKEVPFTDLVLSNENMRKSTTSKAADKELKASIAAHGIIQNLVVTANGSKFAVEAGGRRLAQFAKLVEEKVFSKSDTIPVLVLPEGASAKEISICENTHREEAHSVDEFEAYLYLVEKDNLSVKDVATRFGKTQKYVKQRLALGEVAEELRELCRAGKFSEEILQAFTVSQNHERQLEAYNKYKDDDYRFSDTNIRAYLTDESPSTTDKRMLLVGLTKYKKAGGTVSTDLFEETVYVNDVELLNSMVNEIVQEKIEALQKSWSWAKYDPSFQNWDLNQYELIKKIPVKVPKSLTNKIKQCEDRLEELDKTDVDEFTDELEEEYDKVQDTQWELEEKLESYFTFVEAEKPFAGVIINLDDKGVLNFNEGLVDSKDVKRLDAFRNPASSSDGSDNEEEAEQLDVKPKYSEALRQDLGLYRRAAARVAVCNNQNLGTDLVMFGVCYDLMSDEYIYSGLNIEAKRTFAESSKGDIGSSKAQAVIDESFAKLDRSWLTGSKLDSFKAFRALSAKSKKELCTYCAAASLTSYGVSEEEVEFTRYLFEESKTNPSDYFRPTAHNFFKRVPEPHFSEMATEILGEEFMQENKGQSRPKLSEQLEQAVNNDALCDNPNTSDFLLNWLPEGF